MRDDNLLKMFLVIISVLLVFFAGCIGPDVDNSQNDSQKTGT
ncbi:MAG: hypothetical protein ACLFMM_06595 [Methanohalobium sp.]